MGVKTSLTLEKANLLFKEYSFERIVPTKDGISDTTYLAFSSVGGYVIKYYESARQEEIDAEEELLKSLYNHGLKVNSVLAESENSRRWKLFSYIDGKSILRPNFVEIRQIAIFLAKMHRFTKADRSVKNVFDAKKIKEELQIVKRENIKVYHQIKELEQMSFSDKIGIIHGDLFTDNAKFVSNKLSGVFDFVESGRGSFIQDVGVTALSWASGSLAKKNYFLNCYNNASKVKLSRKELNRGMRFGALYYSMRRFSSQKLDYKELLRKYRDLI